MCIVLCAEAGVAAFITKQYGPIAAFAFFVLLGVYLIISAGSFALDDECVSLQNAFGLFRMHWQEVRKVGVGTQGTIVLHGNGKRFVLAPPSLWSGPDKPGIIFIVFLLI